MANIRLSQFVIAGPFADLAVAKAYDFTGIVNGVVLQIATLGFYRYDATSTATPDDNNIIEPTVGGGRLIRMTPLSLAVNGSGLIEGDNLDLGSIDHNGLQNLPVGDVHTQYAFLNGRAGGQTLTGGTASDDALVFSSTSNATKGDISWGIGTDGLFYDEQNNRITFGEHITSRTINGAALTAITNLGDTGGNSTVSQTIRKASNEASGASVVGLKSRGSFAAPTVPLNGDVAYQTRGCFWDGTEFLEGVRCSDVLLSIGANSVSARHQIQTTAPGVGNPLTTRLAIDHQAVFIDGVPAAFSPISAPGSLGTNGQLFVDSTTNNITYRDPSGTITDLVTGTGGTDEFVKITTNDTTAGFLNDKIVAGAGISTAILNPGVNEQLQISSTGSSQFFDAEVGPTSEFSTVSSALTAGRIRIAVVGDSTETANWILPAGQVLVWVCEGVSLTTDGFRAIGQANTSFYGRGGGNISVSSPVLGGFFDNQAAVANYFIDIKDWRITNNAALTQRTFSYNINTLLENVVINCPNVNNTGFITASSNEFRANNIVVIGGGTSCANALFVLGAVYINGLIFRGEFANSATNPIASLVGVVNGSSISNNIYVEINNTTSYRILFTGVLNNVASAASLGGGVHLQSSGSRPQVNNCNLGGSTGQTSLDISNSDDALVTNVRGGGGLIINNVNNCGINACRFEDSSATTTINGNDNEINTSLIAGSVVINGDDITILGGRVGPNTGGTTNTVTINASANRAILNGVRTDAPVVNNSATSTVIANLIH